MKTQNELSNITTIDEIHSLHLFDLMPNAHVLTGPNGKCMCGIYSGKALSCLQIMSMKSEQIQSAMLADGLSEMMKGKTP